MWNFLAAVDVEKVTMDQSLMTGLILLVVVFAALLALSLVIRLFGKVGSTEKQPKEPKPAPAPKAVKEATSAPKASTVTEDEDEIAAVIAAAVAMMAPAGTTYRVRRITPVGVRARSEWATAAVRRNTMPF